LNKLVKRFSEYNLTGVVAITVVSGSRQTLAVPSALPESANLPSEENATVFTTVLADLHHAGGGR
jgi:hypothetical protein